MSINTKRIVLSISIMLFVILLCASPDNPFQDIKSVDLVIEIPSKLDGFNYCVDEKVQFKVTILLPHLVKKVFVHYDENGDKDEQEITTNESDDAIIFFDYEYKEKGIKNALFTITFRKSDEKRDYTCPVSIGVKPTIKNDRNLLVGGDIILGKSLILTVDHEKFGDVEYKWYKDSKLISGHDQQSLIFDFLKKSDVGRYHCVVKTEWGKDYSETFYLNFKIELPRILRHPQNIKSSIKENAVFTIKATGELINYQWQKNEVDIPNANDTLYEIKDLKVGDSATYRCIVSNKEGSDTSNNALLEVFEEKIAPKISKQPEDQEIEAGNLARFSIVSDGTKLRYQWFENDVEIYGAVSSIFEMGPVSSNDNGKIFHCIVSNDEGKEISKKVLLTVKSISKPEIIEHPRDLTVTEGKSAAFAVNADGNLTYQWLENGGKIVQANEKVYLKRVTTMEDNGKKYSCIVSNSAGDVTSNEAVLIVLKGISKIEIKEHPKNQEVLEGEGVSFLVVASGDSLKYQWQINRGDVVGAIEPKYSLKSTTMEDNGKRFRCIITNSAGSITSDEVVLKVNEKKYMIQFKNTNSKVSMKDIPNMVVPRSKSTISFPDPGYSENDWEFLGWCDTVIYDKDNAYEIGVKTNIAEDKTYWAHWKQNIKHIKIEAKYHSMSLKSDGALWVWGRNDDGQLGNGTTGSLDTPVKIMNDVKSMSAGEYHSLILKTDGTVLSCGNNNMGQLGDGTKISRTDPVIISHDVQAVSAGVRHSLLLKKDGSLWACGDNNTGQLGSGATTDQDTLVKVMGDVKSMSAGGYHSLILKNDGTLWACGLNRYGQLGNDTTIDQDTPVKVMSDVKSMSAGEYHSLILKTNGALFSCGDNSEGQLGNGTFTGSSSPLQIMTGVQSISAKGFHNLILKIDGALWTCGWNEYGQLCDGTNDNRPIPLKVLIGVQDMSAGGYHSLIIKKDGTFWVCGGNSNGQLGDGTTIDRSTPIEIAF